MAARRKINYYIAYNFATRVTFGTLLSVHDSEDTWAFPESYTAKDSRIGCLNMMADNGKTKGSDLHHQSRFLHT